ncbi:MAG: DUF3800 domain-containing protein [Betaproteobacteria bacterium]|nr:DUF3800 domain-containing protein [Betaproteobacteria bacterium]
MYLLYVDESGSVASPSEQYFVLAGLSVFERKVHWVEQKLNEIACGFAPDDPYSIELHGSPMRTGHKVWRKHPQAERINAIQNALKLVRGPDIRLFGAVVKKSSLSAEDPVVHAFEQLTSRFDMFLKRLHNKYKNTQRGIMLFDKSKTEERIQTLAREFKYVGHKWGKTSNYAEVPVFLDSKASRLIQLADLVAYALFRFYEHNDSIFYDIIKNCFDSEGGTIHGLYVRA